MCSNLKPGDIVFVPEIFSFYMVVYSPPYFIYRSREATGCLKEEYIECFWFNDKKEKLTGEFPVKSLKKKYSDC